MTLWPRSLAARTALVLLLGLTVIQAAGLAIHALDRVALQHQADLRELRNRVLVIYRAVILAPPGLREAALRDLDLPPGVTASIDPAPPADDLPPMPLPQDLGPWWRAGPGSGMGPGMGPGMGRVANAFRPREVRVLGGPAYPLTVAALRLPEGAWLVVRAESPRARLFHSPTFLAAFLLMTVTAALLSIWAVRRLTRPVRTLAAAAEALGRDVNAPPLPEGGPSEVATAAAAFNTMAARIRKFVQDRTDLLTAIGHDLRTPITRLKLRAEFMEDDEQRKKMLADLNELEQMVAATLAFGRDSSSAEPLVSLDLAELCRTILDETGDANPGLNDKLAYSGPAHLTILARPLALKRALTNLVTNAVKYGNAARLTLAPPPPRHAGEGRHPRLSPSTDVITLTIADDGLGIPADALETVFEPFRRLETSRNRETGGTGLGLPIARNILRAMGGDVTLANRQPKGLVATVTLPG